MTDETTRDEVRQPMRQGSMSRGVFGVCFQVAWARAARDARDRQRLPRRGGEIRDVPASRSDAGMMVDGENVFERVLI